MSETFEAVVVGGGIVGSSVGYHLSRAGVETVLVDREDEGRATSAGAGIIAPATTGRERSASWFEFAHDAAAYYPELVSDLEAAGEETSFSRPGLLSVAVNDAEVDAFDDVLTRIRERQASMGEPRAGSLTELGSTEAGERFPPLTDVQRAYEYADGGRVDGRVFTDALQSAGESAGLTLAAGDVTDIRVADDSVSGVETADGRRFDAPAVVVAGGAWSGAFTDVLGVDIPVEPHRGQIAHLDLGGADTASWPIVEAYRGHYIVPWPDGRVAVGATREVESGFAAHTTAAGVREVLDEALRVAPGLADAALREVRVGLRPATPDGLPVLGGVPDVDGAFLATGHGPVGLQLGPYSGKAVAERVRAWLGEDTGDLADLSLFDVARFR